MESSQTASSVEGYLMASNAIRQLYAQYARGLDTRDSAMLADCYHPSAVHDHGRFRGGREDFARWAVHEATAHYTATLHTFDQSLIQFADVDHAVVETYGSAAHRNDTPTAGPVDEVVTVRYCDHLRKDEGRWRMDSRTTTYEWTRVDPVELSSDPAVTTAGSGPTGHVSPRSVADLLDFAALEATVAGRLADEPGRPEQNLLHHVCVLSNSGTRAELESYVTSFALAPDGRGGGRLAIAWSRQIDECERGPSGWRSVAHRRDVAWRRLEDVSILAQADQISQPRPGPVQLLTLDHVSIADQATQTLAYVGRAMDRQDGELLHSCLHPDIVTDRDGVLLAGADYTAASIAATEARTVHALHRSRVTSIGSGSVSLSTMCTRTRRINDSGGVAVDETSLLHYRDVLAPYGGRWRIRERHEVTLWLLLRPVTGTRPVPTDAYSVATVDSQDPIYRILGHKRGALS